MRMMGLSDFSYWISWWTYYSTIITIISIVCTIIASSKLIVLSSKGLVFLLFWVYGMSLFGLIVFFQSLFIHPRIAAIVGTLLYYGSSFITTAVDSSDIGTGAKIGASIFTTVAVQLGGEVLIAFESGNTGHTLSNTMILNP